MDPFFEMMRKTHSSPYFDQMKRFCRPLNDHFGINHFWYYRISDSGNYSYMGTHAEWNEYCFGHSLVNHFPCLRHPKALRGGVNLMKADAESDEKFKEVQQIAWDRFHISFNLNLFQNLPDGIEAFGFATKFNDPKSEERLINELPLLRYFTKVFRQKHEKLFQLLVENQVDLSSHMGKTFYERPKELVLPGEIESFLRKLGCESILLLTPRERDILKYLVNGFPASYIKNEIHLGTRTVENYIAIIKDKLSCRSKVELIQKAKEFASAGLFN